MMKINKKFKNYSNKNDGWYTVGLGCDGYHHNTGSIREYFDLSRKYLIERDLKTEEYFERYSNTPNNLL